MVKTRAKTIEGEFLDRDSEVGANIESSGMYGTSMVVMAKSGNLWYRTN